MLSKQRDNAADQAQMKSVSDRVCHKLLQMFSRAQAGDRKYSSYVRNKHGITGEGRGKPTYIAQITCTRVRGANMMTSVLTIYIRWNNDGPGRTGYARRAAHDTK